MAKGEVPKMIGANDYLSQVPSEHQYALNLLKDGLPKDIEDNLMKRFHGGLSGQTLSGKQDLNEAFSSQGNAPVGSLLGGLTSLRGNANKQTSDVTTDLGLQDFNAKQQGFGNLMSLLNLSSGNASKANDFNMNAYNIEESNRFKPGQALGSALTAGASVVKPTCFCYCELFGKNSEEFHYARNWGMANVNNTVRKGYMKLSAILVPVMRKSPLTKKLFKRFVAQPCLNQMQICYQNLCLQPRECHIREKFHDS